MKRLYTPSLPDLSLSYLSISNPSLSKPSHRSFADPYGEINDTQRKPREKSLFGKNPPK